MTARTASPKVRHPQTNPFDEARRNARLIFAKVVHLDPPCPCGSERHIHRGDEASCCSCGHKTELLGGPVCRDRLVMGNQTWPE